MWPFVQEWRFTMRVVLYARSSTTKDQKPELQIEEMRSYCIARGFVIEKEIIDFGYSGTTDKRPGLLELMKLAKGRKIGGVIVLKLDRLFRSLKHLTSSLSEFDELGVQFISIKDQLDMTTSSGRLMANILGSFAEFEADLARERTILGLDHARRLGKILGRPKKHDYSKIIELRKQGLSYRKIAAELNCAEGVVSRVLADARKSVPKSSEKTGLMETLKMIEEVKN